MEIASQIWVLTAFSQQRTFRKVGNMPRRPRIILPGFTHHITHRGNRREAIFREEEDRTFYSGHLQKYSQLHRIRVYSYCLMTNHIHLIVVPETKPGPSRCLHDLHGRYSAYFNQEYNLNDHLLQERFYAFALDNEHLWNAIRYVELNPVRAGIVPDAKEYPWSSAAAHCGLKSDPILDPNFPPEVMRQGWSEWLAKGLPKEDLEHIRQATWKGIPCSSDSFLRQVETMFGVPLLPRRRGRQSDSDLPE